MTTIAVGMIADELGHGRHDAYWMEGRAAHHQCSYSVIPADAYLTEQPRSIFVDWRHNPDEIIGEVRHLELGPGGQLWAVADVDDDSIDPDDVLYWSPSVYGRCPDGMHYHDVTIDSLAITPSPASIGLRPIQFDPQPKRGSLIRQLLDHAAGHHRWERRSATVIAHPPDPYEDRANKWSWPQRDYSPPPPKTDNRPRTCWVPAPDGGKMPVPMEYRGGGRILSVR